jgi:outer membrane protein assembly factor BamB
MTYRGNVARTGEMPGPGPSGSPTIAWQFQAKGTFNSSPVVRDGIVVAASNDGTLHALRLASGDEVWSAPIGSPIEGTPLLAAGNVIVGDVDGRIHGIGFGDGKPIWAVQADGPIHGAGVGDDRLVFITTGSGTAYALDPRDGSVRWHTSLGDKIGRSPALADGSIVVGSGGDVVAIDAADGSVRWRTKVSKSGGIGTPAISAGLVYFATGLDGKDADHGVAALDGTTGAVRWRYASPSHAQVYTPAIVDGRAIVIGHDRRVVALDAASGATGWSLDAPTDIEALPVFSGKTVYVAGNDGPVQGIDVATGRSAWSTPIRGVPFAPAVIGGYLLVGTDMGILYAIGGPDR